MPSRAAPRQCSACASTGRSSSCTECDAIESELKHEESVIRANAEKEMEAERSKPMQKNEIAGIEALKGHREAKKEGKDIKTQNGNVLQTAGTQSVAKKLNISPITIASTNIAEANGEKSSAFIVLRDMDSQGNFTSNFKSENEQKLYSKCSGRGNRQPCHDCCFCDPNLHTQNNHSPKSCNFCSSQRSRREEAANRESRPEIPENSAQREHKGHSRSSTAPPTERIYESRFQSDHRHTQSRESQRTSTQCTRKSFRRIRKVEPDAEDIANGNAKLGNENMKLNNLHKPEGESKKFEKKSTIPKLPPCDSFTNSFEFNSSSTCSSVSSGLSPPTCRRRNSKSVPNLPATGHSEERKGRNDSGVNKKNLLAAEAVTPMQNQIKSSQGEIRKMFAS